MAATYIPATTTDAIIATSIPHYQKQLVDNIFDLSVLLNRLRNKGRVIVDGGSSLVIHPMYEASTDTGWYAGDGALDVTQQEGLRLGEDFWRQAYASVKINSLEKVQNQGRGRLISLMDAKMRQAELSLYNTVGDALYSAARAGSAMNTLVEMVDATSTVHGIDSGADTWWQATNTTSGSASAQLATDMRTLFNSLTINGRTPQMAVTTRTILGYYEGLLTPQQRFTDSSLADSGFVNLKYKNIPVFFDPKCNAGVMYFLNLDSLKFVVHPEYNFSMSPWVKPLNQDLKGAQILLFCNLLTDERRLLGKLNTISA